MVCKLVSRLRTAGLDLPVIVITGHGDVPLAVEAMKAGVADFLEKPFEDDALLAAVRRALAAHSQEEAKRAEHAAAARAIETLSPRERQVLEGLVAGKANKVIAYDLAIESPRARSRSTAPTS